MPEGDTIYRAAVTLRKALLGSGITRFESPLVAVAAVDARAPVAGRRVEAALVWTDGPRLMPIPDALLAED